MSETVIKYSGLRGVLFADFDNRQGPRIVHQSPADFLSAKTFDLVSEFIIAPPEICRKVVKFKANGLVFVGFAMTIENVKYPRGVFLFNVCFVFDMEADTSIWEPCLPLIANALETAEIERAFLSTAATMATVGDILHNMREQLVAQGTCVVDIDGVNSICLQLRAPPRDTTHIQLHDVPVPLADLEALAQPTWDLTIQRIIPWIDGVRFVKRIAAESNVAESLVKEAVAYLVKCRLCGIVDIFQFSNMYMSLPLVRSLCTEHELQTSCLEFVTKPETSTTFRNVYRLICELRPGTRVMDVCLQYEHLVEAIDIRRLVIFGVLHKLIRRVHQYPLCVRHPSLPTSVADADSRSHVVALVKKLANGNATCDEICVITGQSFSTIHQICESDPNLVILHR